MLGLFYNRCIDIVQSGRLLQWHVKKSGVIVLFAQDIISDG